MKQAKDTKTIGSIVRQVRKSQGVTQEQLAAMCGLGRRFIVELENGKETSHLGKTLQVLAALGISLNATDRKGDL